MFWNGRSDPVINLIADSLKLRLVTHLGTSVRFEQGGLALLWKLGCCDCLPNVIELTQFNPEISVIFPDVIPQLPRRNPPGFSMYLISWSLIALIKLSQSLPYCLIFFFDLSRFNHHCSIPTILMLYINLSWSHPKLHPHLAYTFISVSRSHHPRSIPQWVSLTCLLRHV